VHKQNGITSIYVYRPDLTQLHAVIGGVSILREPSTKDLLFAPLPGYRRGNR